MTETLADKIKRESRERQDAHRDKFERLVSEWLSGHAEQRNPSTSDEDEHRDALSERVYEVGRLIAATPSPLPWMVWDKFEILEHYLCDSGEGGNWTHHPELVMLASIKADLMRFKIGEAP
jgi:hypothetical protein